MAIPDFNKAIELDPSYYTAYIDRGSAYYSLGQTENALNDFTQATLICPEKSLAFSKRFIIFNDLKEYDKALTDINGAIELEPENQNNYLLAGSLFSKISRYGQALGYFKKASDLGNTFGKNMYEQMSFALLMDFFFRSPSIIVFQNWVVESPLSLSFEGSVLRYV